MSNADTFCGVFVNAFAKAPTPRELGRIVAHMSVEAQADFWSEYVEAGNDSTALKDRVFHTRAIAFELVKLENLVNSGAASNFIGAMAMFVEEAENLINHNPDDMPF